MRTMKTIFALLFFLPILAIAQKPKTYRSMEEALKNPDDVRISFLTNLGLTEVPKEIAQFKNLYQLNISNNEITSLPLFLFDLTEMSDFDFSNNKINMLPKEIGNWEHLFEIYGSHNLLTSVPGSLFSTPALGFYLDHNQIEELPEEICELRTENLDLSFNRIAFLPDSAGLMRIDQLELKNNSLQEIPESFGARSGIRSLDISYNPINYLPRTLIYCKELSEINITKTKIKRKEIYAFEFMMDWCDFMR
jgi:Leucine-rich repeat (LRR) protein